MVGHKLKKVYTLGCATEINTHLNFYFLRATNLFALSTSTKHKLSVGDRKFPIVKISFYFVFYQQVVKI